MIRHGLHTLSVAKSIVLLHHSTARAFGKLLRMILGIKSALSPMK
jgi:hypothetical protein